jgi:hypothetical protein
MDGWVQVAVTGTLALAATTFGAAATLSWRRRDVPAADMFAALAGLTGLGAASVAGAVALDAPPDLLLATSGAVGLLVPIPWVLFGFEYTGRTELVSPGAAAAIGLLPAAGVVGLVFFVAADLPTGDAASGSVAVAVALLGTIQTLARWCWSAAASCCGRSTGTNTSTPSPGRCSRQPGRCRGCRR